MPAERPGARNVTRRSLLVGAGALGGVVALGGVGYLVAPTSIKRRLGLGEEPFVPDADEGTVKLEHVMSQARGQEVDFYTAVPAGHGDGGGLPVVVALHNASATAADFPHLELARFVTAAVDAGAAPFVLAGATGGALRWTPSGDDDPRAMVVDEIPQWLDDRGFDGSTRALWGWSMGGYGVLRIAELNPDWARAVAAFSPAITPGDDVFRNASGLGSLPLAVWCGTEDPLYSGVKQFTDDLDPPPDIAEYSEGAHTRIFWNDHTIAAFTFLASHLAS